MQAQANLRINATCGGPIAELDFLQTMTDPKEGDMGVNLVTIVRNFAIQTEAFAAGSHDVEDGCVTPGTHRIMRFDRVTATALRLEVCWSANTRWEHRHCRRIFPAVTALLPGCPRPRWW